jgi:diacylglycerol kinase (ATP)
MAFTKILVVANTLACGGKAKNVHQKYLSFLKKNNVPYYSYITTRNNNQQNIQKLIEIEKCDLVSVIGGDGTINIAINSLPNLDIKTHIIPAGTGNDLAKMVYKEGFDLQDIFELPLKQNHNYAPVDIWRCNKRRFCNGFGAGFDGEVAHRTINKTYLISNKLKYWFEIIKLIFSYGNKNIDVNGERLSCFMIAAANGNVYGGNFKVAPKAKIDDELLDLITISKASVLKRLRYLPIVQKGNHLNLPIVSYRQEDHLTISCNEKLAAHVDGEPILDSIYHINFEGKLDVLV